MLTSCEFGSISKYLSVNLDISFLSLHQSADLYLNTLRGGIGGVGATTLDWCKNMSLHISR